MLLSEGRKVAPVIVRVPLKDLITVEPKPEVDQIGRFEWWLESDHLKIHSLDGAEQELMFSGWGMSVEEVSETEIEAVMLYQEALISVSASPGGLSLLFNKLCAMTFADCLALLKEFFND